jgi:hypothetical protein
MTRRTSGVFVSLLTSLFLLPLSTPAQITNGAVTGRVVDSTGGVVPAAHVVLISEARGTRSATVLTNDSGDYVFPERHGRHLHG